MANMVINVRKLLDEDVLTFLQYVKSYCDEHSKKATWTSGGI